MNIHGGSYVIPHNNWNTFMSLYWHDIVEKRKSEYLTEKQLSTEMSPIAVDLDLHFDYSLTERIYSEEHLDDLVDDPPRPLARGLPTAKPGAKEKPLA